MAFTIVKQTTGGSASIADRTAEEKMYTVTSTTTVYDLIEVCRAPGIPRKGDGHPTDPSMRVQRVSARYADTKDRKHFVVTVGYGVPDQSSGSSNSGDTSDPLKEPASKSWTAEAYEEVITEDITGKTIANSAGKPFLASITRTRYRPVLTVSRNRQSYREATALLIGTRNQNSVNIEGTTIGAGRGLLTEYSGERVLSGSFSYWRVTIRVVIDNDGWVTRVADVGYEDSAGKPYVDSSQATTNEPANLDGRGNFKTSQSSGAAILKFNTIPLASWRF